MKLKRIVFSTIIMVILGIHTVFAAYTSENIFELPNEKPSINIYNEKSIDEKIDGKIDINLINGNKSLNKENTKSRKTKTLLRTLQKSEDQYQGNIEENKNEISSTFINREGRHYTYFIDQNVLPIVSIYRYCFETNENVEVYKNEDVAVNDYSLIISNNVYVKNETIYFSGFLKTDNNHLQILGYNTRTEKISYSNSFDITNEKYAESFCIDDNENVYIAINGETENTYRINSYNKNGELINKINQDLFNNYYSIKITNSNNNIILIEGFIADEKYIYPRDIAMRVNNGVFVTGQPIILSNNGLYFTFVDEEKTIAHDQYGDIFKFSYTSDSVSVSIIDQIRLGTANYFYMPYENSSDESFIYAGNEKGVIIRYNWKNCKLERVLSIGENKTIGGVYKSDNKIFIEYLDSEYNVYALVLDYEDFNTPKQILELTEHPNLNRTKEEIKAKYEETDIVNKNNYNSVYEEAPSTTAPYSAGTLNEQTKTDTLNQINYFRWLAGVDEVTINEKYMEYAQCGAVLLTTSSQLMHKPPKPSDMLDEFYKKAIGATNAQIGVSMSANISRYCPIAESIKGYVDDVDNMEPNVGHRLSIIDYKATTTSFGFADKNGTVDMFTVWNTTPENEFYSWPSPGNFPVESIRSKAMWSISYDKTKCFSTGNIDIKLKAGEKEYSSANNDFEVYYDDVYNAFYYKLPSELQTYLTDSNSSIQANKKVEVELSGLADFQGNEYLIKYAVNFFSIENLQEIPTYKKGDVNGDGKVNAGDYVAILNYVRKKITLTDEQLQRADTNGDGKVNAGDYVTVLNIVRGKI